MRRYHRSVLAIEFIDTRLAPDLDDADATARWLFHRGIRSEPTAADLAELARLQSTADHLLRTAVTGEAADAGAIDHLNACSAAAAVAPQLNWPVNGRPRMWLSTSGDSGAHVLGVIARSVIELLTGERARLRVCEAPRLPARLPVGQRPPAMVQRRVRQPRAGRPARRPAAAHRLR